MLEAPFPFIVVASVAALFVKMWYRREVINAKDALGVAQGQRDFAEQRRLATESDLAAHKAIQPKGTALRPAPRVVPRIEHETHPTTRFALANDGDARAVNIEIDPLTRGGVSMAFEAIPQIAQGGKEAFARPRVTYETYSPDYNVGTFLGGAKDVAVPFTVRYQDIDGGRYTTTCTLRWIAASQRAMLEFGSYRRIG